MNKDTIEQFFSMHDWLKEMFINLPESLRLHWKVKKYTTGELVCEQDADVDHISILVEGEMAVERELNSGISYTLATLQPGTILGDIEISLNMPFSNRVYALQPSILLMLNARYFKKWVMNDPYFLRRVNLQLARKLYQSSQKVIANHFYSVRHKLLHYFYEFIQSSSEEQGTYTLVATREEIAAVMGVTVRSVNRTIKALKEEQIVKVKNRRLYFNEYSLQQIKLELSELTQPDKRNQIGTKLEE
jgi:CRP-like cAMP-binding protein